MLYKWLNRSRQNTCSKTYDQIEHTRLCVSAVCLKINSKPTCQRKNRRKRRETEKRCRSLARAKLGVAIYFVAKSAICDRPCVRIWRSYMCANLCGLEQTYESHILRPAIKTRKSFILVYPSSTLPSLIFLKN